jgi:hypothetical protein
MTTDDQDTLLHRFVQDETVSDINIDTAILKRIIDWMQNNHGVHFCQDKALVNRKGKGRDETRSRSKSSSRDSEYEPLLLQFNLNRATTNVNVINNGIIANSIVQTNSQSSVANNKSTMIFNGIQFTSEQGDTNFMFNALKCR